jgi:hypothetical protein
VNTSTCAQTNPALCYSYTDFAEGYYYLNTNPFYFYVIKNANIQDGFLITTFTATTCPEGLTPTPTGTIPVTPTQTPTNTSTPTNTPSNAPSCRTYDIEGYNLNEYVDGTYTNCAGFPDSFSFFGGPGNVGSVCARASTVVITSGNGGAIDVGSC